MCFFMAVPLLPGLMIRMERMLNPLGSVLPGIRALSSRVAETIDIRYYDRL